MFLDGYEPDTDLPAVPLPWNVILGKDDHREILDFKRFLWLGVRPSEARRIPREFPGWIPYCLGTGPAPPVGYDRVASTAWTLPG